MQPRPVAGRADYVAAAVALGVDRVMIDALVRDFYARVRADPLLGPVFAARIIDWEPHLELMGSFWCSVMLRTGTYHGRPMPKHASLPVDARHFDRWLALFEASAVRICPKAGHLFVERARRIAESLELGIAAARGQTLKIEERLASLSTASPEGIGPMSKSSAQPLEDMRLGEIAVLLPGATAVFRRFGLDFCCGGDVLLADAVREPGVALDQIVDELRRLDQSAPSNHPREPAALIDHILERYHETHRRELPELVRLAQKVERVHASHPDAPIGLAAALEHMAIELETHMQKEEAVLFPMMRMGPQPMIAHPIARMRLEHDDHGERLRELEALYRHGRLPEDACGSWQALYAGVKKLADDLMQHIQLENNLLFPQFATDLPATPICPGMANPG